jgi:hypothetical protein
VSPANTGITVTADGSIAGGNQTEIITFNLQNNANGSASSGSKSYTVVVNNTATDSDGANQGSADPNDSIAVSATVVANRTLSGTSVSLGRVMVNQTTGSQNSTISTPSSVMRSPGSRDWIA